MKIPRRYRRRGIAAIIGAVFLFSMLFTIGTSYFIYVNNANNLSSQSLVNRGNTLASRLQENMVVTTALSFGSTNLNHIMFFVNNTGGQLENFTAVIVLSPLSAISACFGTALPSGYGCTASASTASSVSSGDTGTTSFPLSVNTGRGLPAAGYIDTGITWTPGTYTLKIITAQGNIFSGTYPNTAVPVANLAVTTQGAGLLELNFDTFRAYNISVAGCNPSTTSCQLSPWSTGNLAYTMSSEPKTGLFYVFATDITNVDPEKRTIVLDQYCTLNDFTVPKAGAGGGTSSSFPWGIGLVGPTGLTNPVFASITLLPQQTVTMYFTILPGTSTSKFPSSGDFDSVFIYLHGTVGGAPYGQNIPFVTTLYR